MLMSSARRRGAPSVESTPPARGEGSAGLNALLRELLKPSDAL